MGLELGLTPQLVLKWGQELELALGLVLGYEWAQEWKLKGWVLKWEMEPC